MLYHILFFPSFSDYQHLNDIWYLVMSGFKMTNQQLVHQILRYQNRAHTEKLSEWSVYIIVYQRLYGFKMNERLADMTPNRMLLDGIAKKIFFLKDTTNT